MHPEEIKIECERAYAQIEAAKKRLAELRSVCKHERTYIGHYSYRPGAIDQANICEYCAEIMPIDFVLG